MGLCRPNTTWTDDVNDSKQWSEDKEYKAYLGSQFNFATCGTVSLKGSGHLRGYAEGTSWYWLFQVLSGIPRSRPMAAPIAVGPGIDLWEERGQREPCVQAGWHCGRIGHKYQVCSGSSGSCSDSTSHGSSPAITRSHICIRLSITCCPATFPSKYSEYPVNVNSRWRVNISFLSILCKLWNVYIKMFSPLSCVLFSGAGIERRALHMRTRDLPLSHSSCLCYWLLAYS